MNIFKDTGYLVTSAVDGYNVCIFAYGQASEGIRLILENGQVYFVESTLLYSRAPFNILSQARQGAVSIGKLSQGRGWVSFGATRPAPIIHSFVVMPWRSGLFVVSTPTPPCPFLFNWVADDPHPTSPHLASSLSLQATASRLLTAPFRDE